MKVKGLFAIILLVCVTASCGFAATSTQVKKVGESDYSYGGTVGETAFYFSGGVTAVTKTTNLSAGTDTIYAYVARCNSLDHSVIKYDYSKEAKYTGDNVQASVSRYTGTKYEYIHQSIRWDISNPNYANDSNRADSIKYTMTQ